MWSGYLTGDFAADLRRWLPNSAGEPAESETPVEPFLERLASGSVPAARSLARWDTLMRTDGIPDMFRFEEGSQYGFDFAGNDCPVYDDGTDVAADVCALGHDGGGNLYVVTLAGDVRIWDHETCDLEPLGQSGFTSLDAFAWALVRLAAVEEGTLSAAEARAALAVGDAGGFRRFSELADEASGGRERAV